MAIRRLSVLTLVALTLTTPFTPTFAQEEGEKKPPNFNFGGGEQKFCPPFRCTKNHVPVPRRPIKFTSPGCNSGMKGMQVFAPKEGEDPNRPCCDQHNACYQICGMSKTVCDETLQKCNDDLCDSMIDPTEQENCKKSASLTMMLLNMSGCEGFNQSQRNGCECVEKSKAMEKREAVVRYFYKKYSPENMDKVPSLAKKAETSAKLAGLFKKLLLKYPQAIKQIKDPQQEYMENLMKEAKEKANDEKADEEKEEESSAIDEGTEDLDEL